MEGYDQKMQEMLIPAYKPLNKLIASMEEVAGSWNGDEAGREEDRAHTAQDIIGHAEAIKELLEFMHNN